MDIIYADHEMRPELNELIGQYVSTLCFGQPGRIRYHRSLGVFSTSSLIAGVLFHNHYPDAGVVEITAAGSSKIWMTRPVMRAAYEGIAFGILRCQLIALRVSEKNRPMIRIARHMGYSETLIPRLRGRHESEYIFTLTDDAWRASRFASKEFRDGQA